MWARTEFDLNILINLIRLMPEGARMSTLASRPFGRHDAFLWLDAERSSLAVGGTLGGFERPFPTRRGVCLSFQLLLQEAFWARKASSSGAISLKRSACQSAVWSKRAGFSLDHCRASGSDLHAQSRSLKSWQSG